MLKLWDLETQHCFQTLVGHRSEVWSLELIRGETRLLTASGQLGSVRVFSLQLPSAKDQSLQEKVRGCEQCAQTDNGSVYRYHLLLWRWVM